MLKRFYTTIIFQLFFFSIVLNAQQTSPNVILIMADDLGWGDASYNGSIYTTPNLDKMAANGIQFNRFYSASAVSSPTQASVLTGRNPERIGLVHANQGRLGKNEITIAEVLKSNGYTTSHFGKWHSFKEGAVKDQLTRLPVAPNPATNLLKTDVAKYIDKALTYTINNIQGSTVLSGNFAADHQSTVELDLADFENGMYIIQLKAKNQRMVTAKFMMAKNY